MALQSFYCRIIFSTSFFKCSTSSHQAQWVLTLMLLSLLSSLFSLLLCWVRKAFLCQTFLGEKKKNKSRLRIPQGKGIISESVFVGCMWILKVIKIESFTRVRFFFLLPSLPFSFFLLFSFSFSSLSPQLLFITDHRSHCPFNRKFQLLFFFISPNPIWILKDHSLSNLQSKSNKCFWLTQKIINCGRDNNALTFLKMSIS